MAELDPRRGILEVALGGTDTAIQSDVNLAVRNAGKVIAVDGQSGFVCLRCAAHILERGVGGRRGLSIPPPPTHFSAFSPFFPYLSLHLCARLCCWVGNPH